MLFVHGSCDGLLLRRVHANVSHARARARDLDALALARSSLRLSLLKLERIARCCCSRELSI